MMASNRYGDAFGPGARTISKFSAPFETRRAA